MSEDRSISGQKTWLERITQAFAHEPKNRQELLEILREAHQNKLLDNEALAIVEGAIQVADLQVRDIMVPRSQVISIKADQSPREFLPAIIAAAHSRYPVVGESLDEVIGVLLRTLAYLGDDAIGDTSGPGWVRTFEDGERTLAQLTDAGCAMARSLSASEMPPAPHARDIQPDVDVPPVRG